MVSRYLLSKDNSRCMIESFFSFNPSSFFFFLNFISFRNINKLFRLLPFLQKVLFLSPISFFPFSHFLILILFPGALISGSFDRSIKVWTMDRVPPSPSTTLLGHSAEVFFFFFLFLSEKSSFEIVIQNKIKVSCVSSGQEDLIASGSWDRTVRLWRAGGPHRVYFLSLFCFISPKKTIKTHSCFIFESETFFNSTLLIKNSGS